MIVYVCVGGGGGGGGSDQKGVNEVLWYICLYN